MGVELTSKRLRLSELDDHDGAFIQALFTDPD